jgi:hypothetical protein
MTTTEMVLETLVFSLFNPLTWLVARENFIIGKQQLMQCLKTDLVTEVRLHTKVKSFLCISRKKRQVPANMISNSRHVASTATISFSGTRIRPLFRARVRPVLTFPSLQRWVAYVGLQYAFKFLYR